MTSLPMSKIHDHLKNPTQIEAHGLDSTFSLLLLEKLKIQQNRGLTLTPRQSCRL
jgi:hypothetical protein